MKKHTVLVVDVGGRGATLVQKYSQNKRVGKILAVPGHDLMQLVSKKPVKIFPHLQTISVKDIVEIAKKNKVDLVDVAQENGLEAGVVNALQKEHIPVFGPTREAAQIEWDKAWSRNFMKKYDIPHPAYHVFNDEKSGIQFLQKAKDSKWFIKASGLAYGKGVLPATSNKEAIEKIKEMNKFGDSGKTYLLEEWLEGEEFSAHAISDGTQCIHVGNAQDHKRMFNFDEGENTGGMGASAPPLLINKNLQKQIQKILDTTIRGLQKEGRPYVGILYLGGMVVKNKIYVIEFNSRWGDPEAEVNIPSIKNDYYDIITKTLQGKLHTVKINRDTLTRIVVAVTLPKNPQGKMDQNGRQIFGIEKIARMKDIHVYGMRVKKIGKKYFVVTGRLICIMAEGKNVIEARERVYGALAKLFIEGNNTHYRTDIGWRDVERMYVV